MDSDRHGLRPRGHIELSLRCLEMVIGGLFSDTKDGANLPIGFSYSQKRDRFPLARRERTRAIPSHFVWFEALQFLGLLKRVDRHQFQRLMHGLIRWFVRKEKR